MKIYILHIYMKIYIFFFIYMYIYKEPAIKDIYLYINI